MDKPKPLARMDRMGRIGPTEQMVEKQINQEEALSQLQSTPQPLQGTMQWDKGEDRRGEKQSGIKREVSGEPEVMVEDILKKVSDQKAQSSRTPPKSGGSSASKPRGREGDFFGFFKERFGPLIVLILWIALADLEKASFYAPTPEECEELAPHAARLATKVEDFLNIPAWAHSAIMASDDVISIGLIVVGYLDRIGMLVKIKPYFMNSMRRRSNETARSNGSVQGEDRQWGPIPFGVGLQHYEPL
jgi:hypothetical protein